MLLKSPWPHSSTHSPLRHLSGPFFIPTMNSVAWHDNLCRTCYITARSQHHSNSYSTRIGRPFLFSVFRFFSMGGCSLWLSTTQCCFSALHSPSKRHILANVVLDGIYIKERFHLPGKYNHMWQKKQKWCNDKWNSVSGTSVFIKIKMYFHHDHNEVGY